jgi:glycosyltransferase involved in cell wall biosynthesis
MYCNTVAVLKSQPVAGSEMISVIMPSYNSGSFLADAIESVINQTYPHFELIVCDDGSIDETLEIAESYATRDPRIRILRNNFRSVSVNANSGVSAARYPWVARLDADDLATINRLEHQIEAAEREPGVICWGGAAQLINKEGRKLRIARLGPESEAEFNEIRRSGDVIYMMGLTTMIRRDVFLQVGGYDPRFNSADDIELLSRLAEVGSVRALPLVLGSYRLHGTSFTASRSKLQSRLFRFIKARNKARLAGNDLELESYLEALDRQSYVKRVRENLSGLAREYYRHATLGFAERRVFKGLGWGLMAFLADPAYTGRRLKKKAETAGRRRSLKHVA